MYRSIVPCSYSSRARCMGEAATAALAYGTQRRRSHSSCRGWAGNYSPSPTSELKTFYFSLAFDCIWHRFYVTLVMHLRWVRSYSSGGTTKFLTWTLNLNLSAGVQSLPIITLKLSGILISFNFGVIVIITVGDNTVISAVVGFNEDVWPNNNKQ